MEQECTWLSAHLKDAMNLSLAHMHFVKDAGRTANAAGFNQMHQNEDSQQTAAVEFIQERYAMSRHLLISCYDCPADLIVDMPEDFKYDDLVMIKVGYEWGGGIKYDLCPECYKQWIDMVHA